LITVIDFGLVLEAMHQKRVINLAVTIFVRLAAEINDFIASIKGFLRSCKSTSERDSYF